MALRSSETKSRLQGGEGEGRMLNHVLALWANPMSIHHNPVASAAKENVMKKFIALLAMASLAVVMFVGCAPTRLDTGESVVVKAKPVPVVLPFEGGTVKLDNTSHAGARAAGAREVYIFDAVGHARAKAGQPSGTYWLCKAGLKDDNSFVANWREGFKPQSGMGLYAVYTNERGEVMFNDETLDVTIGEDPNEGHKRDLAAMERQMEKDMLKEAHRLSKENAEGLAQVRKDLDGVKSDLSGVKSTLAKLQSALANKESDQDKYNADVAEALAELFAKMKP